MYDACMTCYCVVVGCVWVAALLFGLLSVCVVIPCCVCVLLCCVCACVCCVDVWYVTVCVGVVCCVCVSICCVCVFAVSLCCCCLLCDVLLCGVWLLLSC